MIHLRGSPSRLASGQGQQHQRSLVRNRRPLQFTEAAYDLHPFAFSNRTGRLSGRPCHRALFCAGLAQPASDIMKATLVQPKEKTAEVSTDELRQILADGTAMVFDARPHLEFAISHIPGALNVAPKAGVPMSLYVSDIAEIGRILGGKKDAAIVLYCNGPFLREKQAAG